MRIKCHHPPREVIMQGPMRVRAVLGELQLLPETVLVIRNDALVTEDELVADTDTIEIRPVISGGAGRLGGADCPGGADLNSCTGRSPRIPRHAV